MLPYGFYLCTSNSDPSVFSKRCIFRMKNILSFVFVQFCFLQPSNGKLSIPVDIRQAELRLCSAGYGSLEKSPPQFFLHFLKLVRQKSWILEKTWCNVWTMSWSSKILLQRSLLDKSNILNMRTGFEPMTSWTGIKCSTLSHKNR